MNGCRRGRALLRLYTNSLLKDSCTDNYKVIPMTMPSTRPLLFLRAATRAPVGRRGASFAVLLLLAGTLVLAGCDSGGTAPDDTTPPQVVRAEALSATQLAVFFNEPLDPTSVTPQAFTVSNGVGAPRAAQYVDAAQSATLDLATPMSEGRYTVTVSGVRDAAGNVLSAAQVSFTTGAVPAPGDGEVAIGAAYPSAADSRILLVNKAGTRTVYWTPSSGAFSDAEPVSALENGALPLDDVGATTSTRDDVETFFFNEDGSEFTVYERDESAFDEVEAFGDDNGEFGDPEIEDVGAAVDVSRTQLLLFNRNGTRYGMWNVESETWDGYLNFPADFFGGGAPISAVGAIVFVDEENAYYLFDRDGTKYTVFAGNFSNAFDVTELGDGTLSFD